MASEAWGGVDLKIGLSDGDVFDAAEFVRVFEGACGKAVVPRFRALGASEISEKAPGDPVTAADLECEALLSEAFRRRLPAAAIVGEEACAADPRLKERIASGLAVAIDPVDGTMNFAAGIPLFVSMAALVEDGRVLASWIHLPLEGSTAVAVSGKGAWLDGRRLSVRPPARRQDSATAVSFFVPEDLRPSRAAEFARLGPRLLDHGSAASYRCAGLELLRVAEGRLTGFLSCWCTPWDVLPGALMVQEAGGWAGRSDFAPIDPLDRTSALFASASKEEAGRLFALLAP